MYSYNKMPCSGKLFAIIFTAIILLTFGCIPGLNIGGQSSPNHGQQGGQAGTPNSQSGQISLAQLQESYKTAPPAATEQLGMRYTAQQNLSTQNLIGGLRILANASLAARHPNTTISALGRWKGAEPSIDGNVEWRRLWYSSLAMLPTDQALKQASAVQTDTARPMALRLDAGSFISYNILWKQGNIDGAMRHLSEIYAIAPSREYKTSMEQNFFIWMHSINISELDRLRVNMTPENTRSFPYALVRLEEARRNALDQRTHDLGAEMVEFLRQGSLLADPSIIDRWQEVASAPSITPVAGQTIVLTLPMSGTYGKLSRKVVLGAQIACNEFSAAGHGVNLRVIDTDKSGWEGELAALPENVLLVGGPVRAKDYATAKASGETSRRVFFTFLPKLEGGDEGQSAWRFYASPQDQVDSLLRFTKSIGITSYGTFAPDDSYGNFMADLFARRVHENNIFIGRQSSYPKSSYGEWNKLIGIFLETNKHANRAPSTSFNAIFLPDSWKNMQMLIPGIFYFRETRQVLMGTNLWEQGIASQPPVAEHYYKLAIFPGAWNAQNPSPAVENLRLALANSQLEADFWSSLGYDFARFAATMPVNKGWTAAQINSMLANNPGIPWSSAPISWDEHGQARQELFLFRPVIGGFMPVDPVAFQNDYNRAWGIK